MEARFFCQPVGRSRHLYCPNQGQGTKNIEIQCLKVITNKNQTQWKNSTASVVPLHDDSAMATDPAPLVTLQVSLADPTTETNDRHCQHDSRCPISGVGTAMPSTLKHDNSHIQRASPIRRLPPEHQMPLTSRLDRTNEIITCTEPRQAGPRDNLADNSVTRQPGQSKGNTDADYRAFAH